MESWIKKNVNKMGGSSHSAPYLGRLKLNWCYRCNLPLVSMKECGICGTPTEKIQLTPPGDVRPAFPKEIERARQVIDREFGEGLGKLIFPKGKIYLINKIPGIDLNEEIIADGMVYGIYFYDPIKQSYFFKPKKETGHLIVSYARSHNIDLKHYIEISEDALPFILDGKSILAPGVTYVSQDIMKGKRCLILHEDKYVSLGIASGNYNEIQEMLTENYGKVARNIKKTINNDFKPLKTPSIEKRLNVDAEKNWDRVFRANRKHMEDIVEEAINFIKKIKSNVKKNVAVAYSGGKDSLCVLLLVYRALGPDFKIFFADTGLELPEVLENTRKVANVLKMEDQLMIKSAGDKYWDLIEDFGPPGRDYRFCCHTLKAQQIMEIIEEIADGNKILTFLGQRRYESFNRSEEKRVYVNSFIPLQIAASPIKNWTAIEVWLFILYYPHKIDGTVVDIPATKLYFEGFERLGCYLCPASSLASLDLVREIHPELMSRWDNWLEKHAAEMGYSEEWIKYGLWRYKNLNKKWKNLLRKHEISYRTDKSTKKEGSFQVKISKGLSPCTDRTFSLTAKVDSALNLGLIEKILHVIPGSVKHHDDLGVLSIKSKDYLVNINGDGTLYIQIWDRDYKYKSLLKYLYGLIVKSHRCNNCGVCESICPEKIICIGADEETENNFPTISDKNRNQCIHCYKCITHCPMVQKYRDLLPDF